MGRGEGRKEGVADNPLATLDSLLAHPATRSLSPEKLAKIPGVELKRVIEIQRDAQKREG